MSDWRALEAPAPSRLPSARPASVYGAALFVLVLAVIVGALLFSYAYLATNAETWRPDGTPSPRWWPSVVVVVGVLAAASSLTVGRHDLTSGEHPPVVRLFAAGGLGLASLVAAVVALGDHPFGRDEHAYAAATYLLQGTAGSLVLLATGATALVLAFSLDAGHTPSARADAVRVLRLLWWGTALLVIPLLGTVLVGGA